MPMDFSGFVDRFFSCITLRTSACKDTLAYDLVLSVGNQWKFFKKGSGSGNALEYVDVFSHCLFD